MAQDIAKGLGVEHRCAGTFHADLQRRRYTEIKVKACQCDFCLTGRPDQNPLQMRQNRFCRYTSLHIETYFR